MKIAKNNCPVTPSRQASTIAHLLTGNISPKPIVVRVEKLKQKKYVILGIVEK